MVGRTKISGSVYDYHPRFESQAKQLHAFYCLIAEVDLIFVNGFWKGENKQKEAEIGPHFKNWN